MDTTDLFWDEAREFYERLRERKRWSYREVARRAEVTGTAVTRFFDPGHTYTRIPPIVDKLDEVFDLPRGHGRELLIEGRAGPPASGTDMPDLDQLKARITAADISERKRAELLARIEDIRAQRIQQEAEKHRIHADLQTDSA